MATPAQAPDQEDLTWRLQRTFASPAYKPPLLPAAAVEIMQLAQRPDVSFEKLAPALEHDPVLTARVVAVAQSAAYSARSPILTLHQAAVRLGVKGIRDLVMEAALHLKVFRAPGQDAAMARLARHSGAVAHVVRAVCRHTRLEAEHAFLCGLLHDVGFAACALVLSEDPELRRTPFAELAQVIDQIHVEASALLTKAWGLPLPIQRLVGTHHDVVVNDKVEPLNAALILAEQLVWEAGAGLEPPPPDENPMAARLPEPPLDGIDANWATVVEQAREALRLERLAFCALRVEAFELVARVAGPVPG